MTTEHPIVTMICLVPPPEVSQRLLVPGGDPLSEQHITLTYLGESGDLSDDEAARAHSVAQTVAADNLHYPGDRAPTGGAWPLVGRVNGYGAFSNPGEHALWACWDVPGLDEFRASLARTCRSAGLDPARFSRHGFTAHQTLMYSPRPIERLPLLPEGLPEVVFTELEVWHAGQRIAYTMV